MSTRARVGTAVVGAMVVLALAGAVAVFGQPPPGPMAQPGMGPGSGMGGMMGMCPVCAHMMGRMTQGSALAVTDQAVYVLAGNRVLKYDLALGLMNETEIPMDMSKMHQMMQQMMEQCPMRQQMGPQMGMPEPPAGAPR